MTATSSAILLAVGAFVKTVVLPEPDRPGNKKADPFLSKPEAWRSIIPLSIKLNSKKAVKTELIPSLMVVSGNSAITFNGEEIIIYLVVSLFITILIFDFGDRSCIKKRFLKYFLNSSSLSRTSSQLTTAIKSLSDLFIDFINTTDLVI